MYSACPPQKGPIFGYPYPAPPGSPDGLARRQADVKPSLQFRQVPQARLNGTETRSPTLTRPTAAPTASTMPMFSCPSTIPASISARPS